MGKYPESNAVRVHIRNQSKEYVTAVLECTGMRRLSKYDRLIYFPHCSGDCDWIHPWDTRCDHGHYFPSCRNKRPRLHGQLNSSKTRYCLCWNITAILHTCSLICFLHRHTFSVPFYSFFLLFFTQGLVRSQSTLLITVNQKNNPCPVTFCLLGPGSP